jgi:hypothetical protein
MKEVRRMPISRVVELLGLVARQETKCNADKTRPVIRSNVLIPTDVVKLQTSGLI